MPVCACNLPPIAIEVYNDSYFGTFPGVNNLATAQARRYGIRQYDPIDKTWIAPFRIDASDTADPNHARQVLIAKADGGHAEEREESGSGFDPSYPALMA